MFSWDDYTGCQFLQGAPAQLRHKQLVFILKALQRLRPEGMKLTEVGQSYEGREIHAARLGTGPTRVLAWSQMHGNEPTYTAVLLNLIDLLQRQPAAPAAQAILTNCTLTLVPMLNPDGAETYTRRNAQDIDVNRDALHLASPEGRLLRQLVETMKPQFAFNLHNQQARTSVDGKHVAAVSLLVPPIDEPDTQTEWTRKAKQVVVAFRKAVECKCPGMISRYDADFMPRCFGEWVQQQGIATLTVEAGGWPTIDTTPLVRVHSVGLINALLSIAVGSYREFEPADYDAIPRSSEHYLFDVVVRKVEVVPASGEPFKADIGINYSRQMDRVPQPGGGKIEDLGDLCVTSGKQEIDGTGLKCVPGKIVYAPEFTPRRMPTLEDATKYLQEGITSVVGTIDPASSDAELSELPEALPINVGFVEAANEISKLDRCAIKLGAAADLVFYAGGDVEKVMLGGQIVFENGKLIVRDGGELLRGKGFLSP